MFFRRKKRTGLTGKVTLKPLRYPHKILAVWASAIDGNVELRDGLLASEHYKELGMVVHAILLKEEARHWLMKNGYPHLMAMVNGAEGNRQAIDWLERNNFQVLKQIALAADGNERGFEWLARNGHRSFLAVAQSIKKVKDEIEASHNDVHQFGRD